MTVFAARPVRIAAPRSFAVPVVREIVASGDPTGAVYRT
jgi:hypothetical protein